MANFVFTGARYSQPMNFMYDIANGNLLDLKPFLYFFMTRALLVQVGDFIL
jgi:hypothetical protein